MMETIKSALWHANLMYDLDIEDPETLIEIALVAYNKIGNKNTRLYRYVVDKCDNNEIELPCNCDIIESVNYNYEDWNRTTSDTPFGDYGSQFTENYVENLKQYKIPLYQSGRYVKYTRNGDKLIVEDYHGPIQILYKGQMLDDEGLPLINDKEKDAIACYVAYITKFKEAMRTHNQVIHQEAQMLLQQWLQLCDAARVTEYLTQNEANEILDAKTNWNRKTYGKSFKYL